MLVDGVRWLDGCRSVMLWLEKRHLLLLLFQNAGRRLSLRWIMPCCYMKANGSSSSRHQNGGESHSSLSSPPIVIPGAGANYGTDRPKKLSEDTPLLTSSSSIPTKILNSCRGPPNNAPWGTDTFLYCSPMVSGPRNLRLPDLDLREARRTAAAAANAVIGRVCFQRSA